MPSDNNEHQRTYDARRVPTHPNNQHRQCMSNSSVAFSRCLTCHARFVVVTLVPPAVHAVVAHAPLVVSHHMVALHRPHTCNLILRCPCALKTCSWVNKRTLVGSALWSRAEASLALAFASPAGRNRVHGARHPYTFRLRHALSAPHAVIPTRWERAKCHRRRHEKTLWRGERRVVAPS